MEKYAFPIIVFFSGLSAILSIPAIFIMSIKRKDTSLVREKFRSMAFRVIFAYLFLIIYGISSIYYSIDKILFIARG